MKLKNNSITMKSEIIKQYTHYNLWANELLLKLIGDKISDEKINQTIVSSFPSLLKTIYHIWDAETIWLMRFKGEPVTSWPSKTFTGNYSEAAERMHTIDGAIVTFCESIDDNKLEKSFTYKNIEGKLFDNILWEAILHCMNHSTYHRGQIVTMLRQLGIDEIPSTDFIAFCRI